jgi:serine/threonine protein kinase
MHRSREASEQSAVRLGDGMPLVEPKSPSRYRFGMGTDATGDDELPEALRGMPRIGDVVGRKFVVEDVLGVGGMGVVLGARHVHLGQRVAVKLLLRSAAKHPDAVTRFLREARASVGLQSAHVVRVMDVGTLDDGLPYMVMEHLTGSDLCALLQQRKALPVEEAIDYTLQAMDAVAEAHTVGLVHRDLKPANLFLTRRPDGSGLVKVLDFGISKATESTTRDQSLTATSTIMGSPVYMSPEQLRSSKNVDARTDIWALGIILYELVSGRTPFEDETVTGLCLKIAADPPIPLRERRAEILPAFEAVVMRCLEKDATKRPQTVGELAVAMRPFASPESRLAIDRLVRIGAPAGTLEPGQAAASAPAPSLPSAAVHSTTGLAETVATWQATDGRKRRRTTTVVLACAAVAGVGALAVVRLSRAPTLVTVGTVTAAPVEASAAPPSQTASGQQHAATEPPALGLAAPSAASAPAKSAGDGAAPLRQANKPMTTPPAPTRPADDLLLDRK